MKSTVIEKEVNTDLAVSKNQSAGEIFINSVKAVLGLALFGVGIYLTIQANIGVAPWECLYLGIQKTCGFLYGNISVCASFLIIIIDLLIKERIGIGTIIDAIVVGKTVDLCNYLDLIPQQTSFAMGVVFMLVGLTMNGLGELIYMRSALCCGPRDALMVGLSKRMPKVPIGIVGMMILAVVLFFGWILGGPIGAGTIIGAFLMSPIMQLVFTIFGFVPEEVDHQDLFTSIKVLRHKDKV